MITRLLILLTFASAAWAGGFPVHNRNLRSESGLAGYYRMDGSPSDSSGYSVHAAISNGPAAYLTGIVGNAIKSSTGAYAEIPFNARQDRSLQMTVSAWVYRTGNFANAHYDIVGRYLGVAQDWTMEVTASGGGFTFNHLIFCWHGAGTRTLWGGIDADTVATSLLSSNQWTHVTAVRSGGGTPAESLFYVNGKTVATTAFGSAAPGLTYSVNATIGGDSAGNSFPGIIDDVRIYNRALSATEIAQLYADTNLAKRDTPLPDWLALFTWRLR